LDLKHPMMYSLGNKKLHLLVEFRIIIIIRRISNQLDSEIAKFTTIPSI